MIEEARAAIARFEEMIDYLAEREPERIARPGFQRLVLAMADLEAACDDALSDPSAPGATPARASDPDTSKAAAQFIAPRAGTLRANVLEAVKQARSNGLTHPELEALFPESAASSVRTRCSELVDGGWVEDSGMRRSTTSGLETIVWVLTDEAARRLL